MNHDPNCIFCKIIQDEIPSAKVFENEDVYAFLDICQVTKGHTLVIPKNHEQDLYHLQPETAAKVFAVIPRIAQSIKQQFQPIGLNLLNNNEAPAGQSVFHYHVHLIPRYGEGDGFGAVWKEHGSEYTPDALAKIASTIAEGIMA